MSLEESLARIASALEKIAGNTENHTSDKSDAGKVVEKSSKTKEPETTKAETKPAETKAKPEAKADKPKLDFNKDIRAVFLTLLTTAKDRADIGPKGAAQIAIKLLTDFTTNPKEPLSAKTLPEDKYDAFIEAVNAKLEQLNGPEGEDSEELPGV